MTSSIPTHPLTPDHVERAGRRDAKHYELISGQLRAKPTGTETIFIACRLCQRLNEAFDPARAFAVPHAMLYCFDRPDHGRKPSVAFIPRHKLLDGRIPVGDLTIAPDLVAEVLAPESTALELEERLTEYQDAGIPLVWIIHPERKTIRVYRNDGTTCLFHSTDTIANEPLLPGLSLPVADIFPR